MKIVRHAEIKPEIREDGRIVYSFFDFLFSKDKKSKFFKVKIPRGTIEKEHYHKDSDEIFYFIKPGQITINKKVFDFFEGDMVILERNDRHKIIALSDMELIGIKSPGDNDKVLVEDETY